MKRYLYFALGLSLGLSASAQAYPKPLKLQIAEQAHTRRAGASPIVPTTTTAPAAPVFAITGAPWHCAPISYSVDTSGNRFNQNPSETVNAAVRMASEASGWSFHHVGVRGGEVHVQWVDRSTFVDGRRAQATRTLVELGSHRYQLVTTVAHELGHVLGLGHVNAPHELMSTGEGRQARDYGPGDRIGFAQLRGRCA